MQDLHLQPHSPHPKSPNSHSHLQPFPFRSRSNRINFYVQMPKAVGRRSLNVSRGRNSICSTSVAESEGLKNKQATGTANAKKVQMSDWPKDQRRRKQKDEEAGSQINRYKPVAKVSPRRAGKNTTWLLFLLLCNAND